MSQLSRADRTRLWIDRLKRHISSGKTIAAFCLAEGVSVPSFYQWRRKLAPQKLQASNEHRQSLKGPNPTKAFAQLTVVGNGPLQSTIELPGSIRITLGTDQQTIATIVQQLLQPVAGATEEASC